MAPTKLGDLKSLKIIRLFILNLNSSKSLKTFQSSYTKYRAIAFDVKETQNELNLI